LPRVVTRTQALALGYSRRAIEHRLATGRWRRLLPAVYLTVDTLTTTDRINAALAFAGEGAALSGLAALRCSDVRGIAMPDRLLVLVPPPNRRRSAGWVQIRRTFRPINVVEWYGPRRVEVARAAADAALAMTRLDDVRALVAKVIQQQHCTLAELGTELAEGPRNGSGFLRQAMAEVGWGAESAPEARAARILRRAGITGWRQNYWIKLRDGRWRKVDFYWPRLRAALEIDGKQYHFRQGKWEKTLDRDVDLAKVSVAVIHRPPSALSDEAAFANDVRGWLLGRERDLHLGIA
jgi:very-short-patch-repair endonuclease